MYSLSYYHIRHTSVSILCTIGINTCCIIQYICTLCNCLLWTLSSCTCTFHGSSPLTFFSHDIKPCIIQEYNYHIKQGITMQASTTYLNWEKCKKWILAYNLYYHYMFYFYKILNELPYLFMFTFQLLSVVKCNHFLLLLTKDKNFTVAFNWFKPVRM